MKILLSIIMGSIFLANCISSPDNNLAPKLNHVLVYYDDGRILRIVSPKSNDLVRWSKSENHNSLLIQEFKDGDTLMIYRDLLSSAIIDTMTHIHTILNPINKKLENGLEISYFDETNDIKADAMIIYIYEDEHCANDTLFLNYIDGTEFRVNNNKAYGDTIAWKKIKKILVND